MANNMTYESAGDIQPPAAPPPPLFIMALRWATEASTKDKFACHDLVTAGEGWGGRGLLRRLYSFTSQRRVHSEINDTDRYVESFSTV